jgi:transposase-like protein
VNQDPPETLPPEAEDALRDSIAEFGVLVPVCVSADGVPFEGRHRARIADALGVSYPTWVHQADTDPDKLRKRLNNDRRALPVQTRRELVAYLTRHRHSHRAIARALRAGKHTIARDVAWLNQHQRADDTDHGPAIAPSPSPEEQTAPSTQQAARFVSTLAEITAAATALSQHDDLATVLTPEQARQWTPSVTRALSGLRALQSRMKEHAKP